MSRFLCSATIALTIALVLLVLSLPPITAAIGSGVDVNVDTTTDAYNGAGCSLRDAIQTVNNGVNHGGCFRVNNFTAFNRVFVPPGTFSLTLPGSGDDFNVTGDLDIRTSMIISATGAVTVTGQSAWADRIFHLITGTESVTLKGLVISGGSAPGGGGILIEPGTSLTFDDGAVISNTSIFGGGIYNNQGNLTLNQVTVHGNNATCGNCLSDGGGIENYFGTATLDNVTISNNSAGYVGGGIATVAGAMTLANVTISGNNVRGGSTTDAGGGIYTGSPLTLTNVTVSGNYAPNGGGIYVGFYMASLTNVTLSGNSASASNGGGIDRNGGTVEILNTIVANSFTGVNCNTTIGGSYNLSSDNTCGFGLGDNVNVMLGPLADNGGATQTHALLPGSPAIDAIPLGTSGCGVTITTDQRGAPRPINGKCDIGAVEYGGLLSRIYLPLLIK